MVARLEAGEHGWVVERRTIAVFTARVAALTAVAVVLMACAAPVAARERPAGGCGTARGPFRVVDARVLSADGAAYVPYGMTVAGLGNADYQGRVAADGRRIEATARVWCANTVRLQLRQDNLIGVPEGQARAFLAAIEREVALAERDQLVVVLNDQTETTVPGTDTVSGEPGPTQATTAFWHALASVYGHDSQVIFDLFNEPRWRTAKREPADCAPQDWQLWQRGGTWHGTSYVGMRQLVASVRADGATNLLWVEGPCWASTLAHVPSYPVTGGPLAYAFHHPAGHAPHTPGEWDADFGFLVEHNLVPVVDGEWTNRSSGTSSNCWTDAPSAVPAYLDYLAAHNIGLVAFQLAKGFMTASATDLAEPTHIDPRDWRCADPALNQGAGALVMAWFRRHNTV